MFSQPHGLRMPLNRCYTNPATDLIIPGYASIKEVPALTQFQQQRVEAAAAADPLGDIILFLLNSGLRAGELINLEWINYDNRHQEIHIRESKTKAGIRTLPLTPTLITIIERQPHICDSILQAHGEHLLQNLFSVSCTCVFAKKLELTFLQTMFAVTLLLPA